ncbi:MAG: hypothetical protein CM15mP88_0010 [Pseudomonadota bacterium]|nr:MAG: hypothetical protein CM15mP88_0010 [Pseudomonadota bacterium]
MPMASRKDRKFLKKASGIHQLYFPGCRELIEVWSTFACRETLMGPCKSALGFCKLQGREGKLRYPRAWQNRGLFFWTRG